MMLAGMVLAMALAAEAPKAAAGAPPFSPNAQALIDDMHGAIARVRARQAALPPPNDDAERLVRMGELDQAARRVVVKFDFSSIPAEERGRALEVAVAPMEATDLANQQALVGMVPPEGWFTRGRYGEAASQAAFHVVQHADVDLQRRFLPKLEALARSGEGDGQAFAMMSDRVAISEGRPQRYGTQFRCDGGKWRPYPFENEAEVDALRRGVGVDFTYAEYKKVMQDSPPCPQTLSPPPPGMKLD